jgi:hypothetical protein
MPVVDARKSANGGAAVGWVASACLTFVLLLGTLLLGTPLHGVKLDVSSRGTIICWKPDVRVIATYRIGSMQFNFLRHDLPGRIPGAW